MPPETDRSGEPIHVAAELLGVERVEVLSSGTDHRLFEVLDQEFPVDVPITSNGVEDAKGFSVHGEEDVRFGWLVVERFGFGPGRSVCTEPTRLQVSSTNRATRPLKTRGPSQRGGG
jgi:hypothetical protein